MSRTIPTAGLLQRVATSFGVLHATHTGLNLVFTLVQLLVFARGLDTTRYAEVVFLTAIAVYMQPIGQAIGRANYVALGARGTGAASAREVVWMLYVQAALLTAMSFIVPLFLGGGGSAHYLGNALYLFGCLATNYWSFDLQSTAWSAGLERAFALISILRRALFLAALAVFWFTGDFIAFGAITSVVVVLFIGVLLRLVTRHAPSIDLRPGPVTGGGIVSYLRQFYTSLLSALTELLILNSPYAVLTVLFGVGPVLIAFDTVMKIGRLAMAGTRALSEICLPGISRSLSSGDAAGARRKVLGVTAACVAATAVPAAAIFFFGPAIFGLLLGPNNVVSPDAASAGALIVLTTGLYQPTIFFLSFLDADIAIRRLTATACAGVAAYAIMAWLFGSDAVSFLWIYAVFFLALSCLATVYASQKRPSRNRLKE